MTVFLSICLSVCVLLIDTNRCLSLSIMSACVTAALQPDRLLAEHMLLVAVLHRLVDTDVGMLLMPALCML